LVPPPGDRRLPQKRMESADERKLSSLLRRGREPRCPLERGPLLVDLGGREAGSYRAPSPRDLKGLGAGGAPTGCLLSVACPFERASAPVRWRSLSSSAGLRPCRLALGSPVDGEMEGRGGEGDGSRVADRPPLPPTGDRGGGITSLGAHFEDGWFPVQGPSVPRAIASLLRVALGLAGPPTRLVAESKRSAGKTPQNPNGKCGISARFRVASPSSSS